MAKVAGDSCLIRFRTDELSLLIVNLPASDDLAMDALKHKLALAREVAIKRKEATDIEYDLSS